MSRVTSTMLARVLSDAAMLLRLARDLRSFVAAPISGARAAETVKQQLETRNERFLAMLERSVFGHPRSPYRWLLRTAGCELDDIRALVKAETIEGTLQRLSEASVYVTFDEFKGRTPLIRGSQRLDVTEHDFDPPGAAAHLETQTGGSRGAGTALKIDLAFIADRAVQSALGFEAHVLRRTFLDELGRDGWSERLMAGAWERADAVVVRRVHPLPTTASKILPSHLVEQAVEQRSYAWSSSTASS